MIVKSPIIPTRIRKIPKSFSWIDHRLVRDRYIESCSHASAALYLFLTCVADHRGLSYYGDQSICRILNMDQATLDQARSQLRQVGLIAWSRPIYQVLSLEPLNNEQRSSKQALISLGAILKQTAEVDADA